MQGNVRCPVGLQTFTDYVEGNFLYVDKTAYVYNITHGSAKYYFLSRPRRFGKTLFVSTLETYFEGKKDYFEGLAIEKLEKEWIEYPVIRLDLSGIKGIKKSELIEYLNDLIDDERYRHKVEVNGTTVNVRFKNLIKGLYEKTGKKVVVLIDEYDAPLLDVVHEEKMLPALRDVMRNFYSPLKKCDKMLKFVFLTGITKFSQMSIFSELNNITNISLLPEYAGVCGVTESELYGKARPAVEELAVAKGLTFDDVMIKLKQLYDGYHFTWPSEDVYNPYGLMTCLAHKVFGSHWFDSGTPTYLIEMLRKFNIQPSQVGDTMTARAEDFDAPTEKMTEFVPLLYQSGYFTIKGIEEGCDRYILGIPNNEVRIGLMNSLIVNYVGGSSRVCSNIVAEMSKSFREDDINKVLTLLKAFLETVPYTDNTDFEGHYQQKLYVIFSMLGAYVDVEVHTAFGRVDMVAKAQGKLYLFELKLNQSAKAAMNQMELKDYHKRFQLTGLPVVKVAINFNKRKRTLGKWIVSEA